MAKKVAYVLLVMIYVWNLLSMFGGNRITWHTVHARDKKRLQCIAITPIILSRTPIGVWEVCCIPFLSMDLKGYTVCCHRN